MSYGKIFTAIVRVYSEEIFFHKSFVNIGCALSRIKAANFDGIQFDSIMRRIINE